MDDMKVQDAQLTEQLADMNRAPEDKKMGLMAAVITHMVEQRIAMDARKAKMEEEMMKHMMQHMQMGKESMSQCPMMKDMDDKSGNDHKEHQKVLCGHSPIYHPYPSSSGTATLIPCPSAYVASCASSFLPPSLPFAHPWRSAAPP